MVANNNDLNFSKFDVNHSCTMCQATVLADHREILTFLEATLRQDHNFYKEVSHTVYRFVDDSNSCIGLNNEIIMKNYLEIYLKIMLNYYNINKLKLNTSKTKYIINCKKSLRPKIKDFKLNVDNENIYPEGNIRILGVLFSTDNSYTVYCNDLISPINYRFINLMKVKKTN